MHGPLNDRHPKSQSAAPGDDASSRADAALVERAAGGDAVAFESLVRRHYDGVWRVVHRIVRREREAEAVVQEVFLRARAALPQYRGEPPLDAWLRRLAVEHAVRAVRPGRSRRQGVGGGRNGRVSERRRAPRPPDPTQDRRLLEASLAALDGAQRAPLALQIEGLDYAAIAGELDVPVATVRSRISVARQYISRCIDARRTIDVP